MCEVVCCSIAASDFVDFFVRRPARLLAKVFNNEQAPPPDLETSVPDYFRQPPPRLIFFQFIPSLDSLREPSTTFAAASSCLNLRLGS